MKRLKYSKGFTLVELLVTIVLLGVVGAVIIYNMTGIQASSKEKEYERFVSAVKSAAATYADSNPEIKSSLYVDKAFNYIEVKDLIEKGFLDDKITNPYTGEYINPSEKVKATLDSSTGGVIFVYPVVASEQDKESYLVALSDYIVYGEPYDCMQGFGTYEFALSRENGDLILPNENGNGSAEDIINKYGVTCEMPKEFHRLSEKDNSTVNAIIAGTSSKRENVYYLDVPQNSDDYKSGTYEINYTWISESGTKKQFSRVLRALNKAVPVLDFQGSNKDYNNYYQTNTADNYKVGKVVYKDVLDDEGNIIINNHGIKKQVLSEVLSYVVSFDGGDTVKFSTTAKAKNTNTVTNVCSANGVGSPECKANDTVYTVDDGIKNYEFSFDVYGHHYSHYSYHHSKSYWLACDVPVNLVNVDVPTINNDSANNITANAPGVWASSRVVTVNPKLSSVNTNANNHVASQVVQRYADNQEIYSPSILTGFEFYGFDDDDITDPFDYTELMQDESRKKLAGSTKDNGSSNNLTANVTGTYSLNVDAFGSRNTASKYRKTRIRAVNKDGFRGSWSEPIYVYVSDYINDLTYSKCTGTNCSATSSTDSTSCGQTASALNKATYSFPVVYAQYPQGSSFVLTDAYSETGSATKTGGTTTGIFSGLTGDFSVTKTGHSVTWGVETCNGYFEATYTYYTVDISNVKSESFKLCRNASNENDLCQFNNTNRYQTLNQTVYDSYKGITKELFKGNYCMYNDWVNTSYHTSSTSHGESRGYTSQSISTYHGTGSICRTGCIVKFKPATFARGGVGTSIAPYLLA